jgi:hypothetical protein
MTRNLKAAVLHTGEKFTVAGREYIALDHVGAGVFAIEAKNCGVKSFGKTNNWCACVRIVV